MACDNSAPMTSRKREPLRWRRLHRSVDATHDAASHTPNHRKSVKVWNHPQKHHRNSQLKKNKKNNNPRPRVLKSPWVQHRGIYSATATFASSAFVSVCVSCESNLTPAFTRAQNISLIHLFTHVPRIKKKKQNQKWTRTLLSSLLLRLLDALQLSLTSLLQLPLLLLCIILYTWTQGGQGTGLSIGPCVKLMKQTRVENRASSSLNMFIRCINTELHSSSRHLTWC